MTVIHFLRWTCDTCGAQAEREGSHGFPTKQWSVIPSEAFQRAGVRYRTLNECPECTAARTPDTPVPDEQPKG